MRHVLWTGGWDSTFRVLDLVLIRREIVQTYYIFDPDRASTQMELAAMRRIRETVLHRFPDAADRFLPPVTMARDAIPAEEETTRQYRSLAKKMMLGSQYDWLCRFAHSFGAGDMELCVEGSADPDTSPFYRALRYGGNTVPVSAENDFYYVLKEPPALPELRMFRGIRFPLLDETKRTLAASAAEKGFADILEMTWFCHTPSKDGKPCGVCHPCRQVRLEGLGRRLPPLTLKSRASLLKNDINAYLRRLRARF